MDREQVIALWLWYRRQKRQRRSNRIYWVHPISQGREEVGLFYTLFEDLRRYEKKFFNFFRMSYSSFDELHNKLRDSIQGQHTHWRNCIEPVQMLAITLRYLASGCTFTDLHYHYRIGISTAAKIVEDVCTAIWSIMREECIPTPTVATWESIASDFERVANFPHCLGAVDGKHVRLTCPFNSGSMYFNYKDYFSTVLMAVVDSNYRFVYVDVGSYGKECDPTIFKRSSLWKSIEDGTRIIPEKRPLTGTESPKIPFFFIGDAAFGLHKNLFRPYAGTHLTVPKKIFNYRLCRARRYVECAFGILSNKWHIFHRAISVQPDIAIKIVNACLVLHNFVRDQDGYMPEDMNTITGLEDLEPQINLRGGLAANSVRNILCDYFVSSVGSVSWQMSKI